MLRLMSLWILLLPALLAAQTAGLPSLRLSSGARPAGMADLSAALRGPESANPAALSATTTRVYAFSHNAWIEGIEQQHLHVVEQRAHSAWALRAQVWQADGLDYRTGPSTEPLGTFGVYDLSTGLVYARHLSDNLRLGGQLKLLRQSISTESATGYGLDLGLLYSVGRELLAGIALLNAGSMSKLDRIATPLPTEVRAGMTYGGLTDLLVGLDLQKARDTDLSIHLGGQYQALDLLALRLGYQTAENRGVSAGLSLFVRSWTIEYAYMPFGSGLGQAHQLSLRFNGGETVQ